MNRGRPTPAEARGRVDDLADAGTASDDGGGSVDAGAGALRDAVKRAMETYFENLDGHDCRGVYQLVLSQIEPPLLEAVLEHASHNQSRAATILGINRGTLRKKLRRYGLD